MIAAVSRRCAGVLMLLALSTAATFAKDGPVNRDWSTEVDVAPGAMTWTSDNFENKKQLIGDTAAAQGKVCTGSYAALGWPSAAGNPDVIMRATRERYEKAGFTVAQKRGEIDTESVWVVRSEAREAVILWGALSGSTIYISCRVADAPALPAPR